MGGRGKVSAKRTSYQLFFPGAARKCNASRVACLLQPINRAISVTKLFREYVRGYAYNSNDDGARHFRDSRLDGPFLSCGVYIVSLIDTYERVSVDSS